MKKMTVQNNRIVAAKLAATISLSAVVVSKFEGLEFTAYKDLVCLLEIFPEETAQHDYRIVGAAYAKATADATQGVTTGKWIKDRTRELLSDVHEVSKLKSEVALMEHDPWKWGIDRYLRGKAYSAKLSKV